MESGSERSVLFSKSYLHIQAREIFNFLITGKSWRNEVFQDTTLDSELHLGSAQPWNRLH
jgi:hypothetical protein